MPNLLSLLLTLWVLCVLAGCDAYSLTPGSMIESSESRPGGAMTAKRLSTSTYISPGRGLDKQRQLEFWTGFSLFRDPWVIAPSSTRDRDGLGPLFNARSCIACHKGGGRAAIAKKGVKGEDFLPLALVVRLGPLSPHSAARYPALDIKYGGQIQPRSIARDKPDLSGEAWLNLTYQTLQGQFADGRRYTLYKPEYRLEKLAAGPLAHGIGLSPRLAPNVFGMGLLDAIDEQDLLAQEDVDDRDGNGISAKYNRVPNVLTGERQIGRFGFKAKQPTLHQQVAAAFRDDIGITNSLFEQESCAKRQAACRQLATQTRDSELEIPDKLLTLVTTFNRFLAVPPARDLSKTETRAGRRLFYQLQCAVCHTPGYVTKTQGVPAAMAGQRIWPYTDLALHDMGEGLADGVTEFDANGREWRTPPLWGIGLQETVSGQSHYLHDGRARTIEEAILWHGGEAMKAKQGYLQLSATERQHLLQFLRAI